MVDLNSNALTIVICSVIIHTYVNIKSTSLISRFTRKSRITKCTGLPQRANLPRCDPSYTTRTIINQFEFILIRPVTSQNFIIDLYTKKKKAQNIRLFTLVFMSK